MQIMFMYTWWLFMLSFQALGWWFYFYWLIFTEDQVWSWAPVDENTNSRHFRRNIIDRDKVPIQNYNAALCLYSHYMLRDFWIHLLTRLRFGARDIDFQCVRLKISIKLDRLLWPCHYMKCHLVEPPIDCFIFLCIGYGLMYEIGKRFYLLLRFCYSQKQQHATRETQSCNTHHSSNRQYASRCIYVTSRSKSRCHRSRNRTKTGHVKQKTSNKVHSKKNLHVYCTNYATVLSSQIEADINKVHFDPDGTSVIVDNSANAHIVNDKSLFVSDIKPMDPSTGVATIGGKDHRPEGIGTIRLSWRDDEGKSYTYHLKNTLFFTESPVNILSVTKLADFFNDDEGMYVKTMQKESILVWDHGKAQITFRHSESCLPELHVNTGFNSYRTYYPKFRQYVNDKVWHAHSSIVTALATNGFVKETDFDNPCYVIDNEEKEVEQTREPLQQKDQLDDPNSLTSSDTWRDSDNEFNVGKIVRYVGPNEHEFVTILSYDTINNEKRYVVQRKNGQQFQTQESSLWHQSTPDIANIPVTNDQYSEQSKHLTPEECSKIANAESLDLLQQEYMSWHRRLGHLPKKVMLTMARLGILPRRFLCLEERGAIPVCASCMFGQAHRKPWRTKAKSSKKKIRRDDDTAPGKGTSTNQLVSNQPGLVPQVSGRLTSARIVGATVYVDHFSDYTYVYLMRSLSSEETLASKHGYEREAAKHDGNVRRYHADNGRFGDKSFRDKCHKAGQELSFCGVGAHHQNGIVENRIKILTLVSRTLLLHAKRYWPKYITVMLWPYALLAAADRLNRFNVDEKGVSPEEKFAEVEIIRELRDEHTWGCPVYVLDQTLQGGFGGLPKWDPRVRVGINLGRSRSHAGNVHLILNPRTGHVSPQYHVVFDEEFSIVPNLRDGTVPPFWKELVKKGAVQYTTAPFDLTDTWELPNDVQLSKKDSILDTPVNPIQIMEPQIAPDLSVPDTTDPSTQPQNPSQPLSLNPVPLTYTSTDQEGASNMVMPQIVDLASSGLRRSPRLSKLTERAQASNDKEAKANYGLCSMMNAMATKASDMKDLTISLQQPAIYNIEVSNALYDNSTNWIHPMAFAANQQQNETYTFRDMMKQPDQKDFIAAMMKEIEVHEGRNHWTCIKKSEVPREKLDKKGQLKTILSIWSFKRKRFPSGKLMKHRARLCAHSGMQQWGLDFWETFSPVVMWITVRALLTVAAIHGLPSKCIDFVLAFPQAELDVDVFMELPIGMTVESGNPKEYVLRLNKSIYGLKQSSLNWFKLLSGALQKKG